MKLGHMSDTSWFSSSKLGLDLNIIIDPKFTFHSQNPEFMRITVFLDNKSFRWKNLEI